MYSLCKKFLGHGKTAVPQRGSSEIRVNEMFGDEMFRVNEMFGEDRKSALAIFLVPNRSVALDGKACMLNYL